LHHRQVDDVGATAWLPAPPDQAEATARILDRLSEEVAEAAAYMRGRTPAETGGAVGA